MFVKKHVSNYDDSKSSEWGESERARERMNEDAKRVEKDT